MKQLVITLLLVFCLFIGLSATATAEDYSKAEQYLPYINKVADMYQVSPELIEAIIIVESAGNADITSRCGAQGLMQVRPEFNQERLRILNEGGNLYDPYTNILVGTDLLMEYADKYEDVYLVLVAYNCGEYSSTFKKCQATGCSNAYADSVLKLAKDLEVRHGK